MAALAPEQFRRALARAGISDEKPLYPILTTLYETAAEARAVVGTGARGLSPAGEKELIARVAEASAEAAQHEVERLARRIGWRNAGLMAAVGFALLGSGYLTGRLSAEVGPGKDDSFLAQLGRSNDVAAVERYCRAHTVQQDGGTVCQMPSVWVKR